MDLGVNHLYSRQVGIAEHDDAVYIAPEVKNRHRLHAMADVYSLGVILMHILAGQPPRDGRTPEAVWTASPILGRTLEDLIEEAADNRLLLMPDNERHSYSSLRAHLDFCFELVSREPVTSRSLWGYRWAQIAPTSREFRTQLKQWWTWRRGEGRKPEYERYLLLFSALSSFSWWLIVAKTALF
ncbi:hypothetical protein [Actinomadura sp. DC4]|uniref:hypothetical protein n=1 Tax=Actinomadura sp. DC4 TaxID=3055069 RepID=UPI0025B18CFD|nr:hypothetical protein [Actinomadura sp. DC4]MDN3357618.1 hypothetical protein [Actinomadura sp. DC4]